MRRALVVEAAGLVAEGELGAAEEGRVAMEVALAGRAAECF